MFFAVAEQAVTFKTPDEKFIGLKFAVNPANTALVDLTVTLQDGSQQVATFNRQGGLLGVALVEPPKKDEKKPLDKDEPAKVDFSDAKPLVTLGPEPAQPFSPAPNPNVTPPRPIV